MAKASRSRPGGAARGRRHPITTPPSTHVSGNGAGPAEYRAGGWAGSSPDPDAVAAFERAMTALQRHDYRSARDAFVALLRQFPSEGALLDRARVYLSLCERELQRATLATGPQSLEERLTAATAALNNDQEGLAEQLLVAIVEEAPAHELGHYLTAVLLARRGHFADAVAALERAAAISPDILAQARHDEDFENLRGEAAFERLLASQQ